jgi:hypothetical protein
VGVDILPVKFRISQRSWEVLCSFYNVDFMKFALCNTDKTLR